MKGIFGMKTFENVQTMGNRQNVGNNLERAKMYRNILKTNGIGTVSIHICSILTIFACLLACCVPPAFAQATWTGQGTYEIAVSPTVASLDSCYIAGDCADSLEFLIGYGTGADYEVLTFTLGVTHYSIQEVADEINIQSRAIQPGWNAASIYGSEIAGYRLFLTSHTAGDTARIFFRNTGAVVWGDGVSGCAWNEVATYGFMHADGSAGWYDGYDAGYIGLEPESNEELTHSAGSLPLNYFMLNVGYEGNGVFNITNDARVNSNYCFVGQCVGSTGEINVDGDWTIFKSSSLHVGRFGNGVLNISDDAYVGSDGCYIGHYPGSTGVVNIDGEGSTLNATSELIVGLAGNGTLNITNAGINGGLHSESTYIGYEASGTGEVNMDNGRLSCNDLYVGYKGNGTLNVTENSMLDLDQGIMNIGYEAGSTGVVNIEGADLGFHPFAEIRVGYQGDGTLNITDGGVVNNYGCLIGDEAGSTGIVTVDGIGSKLTSDLGLHIGKEGNGTLNIINGGTVCVSESDYLHSSIGYDTGATGFVNVTGAGSTWTVNARIDIGNYGSGSLNITNGGTVNCEDALIGHFDGSTGVALVDGLGSTWNTDEMIVGARGSGSLIIKNGGTVKCNTSLIGNFNSDKALVNGSGSTWTTAEDLYVGYFGDGALTITDGGLVSVGGLLTMDYDTYGDNFINMATGGMLALHSDVDASGSLGDFLDLIAGTDAIRYWDDTILDWADITGATMGEDYWLTYLTEGELAGYTMLTVGQAILSGDANNDGVVSAADYACVQANFGQAGIPGMLGDANGDGVVSAGDYAAVQANFGNLASAVVPEPVTLSIIALGSLAMLRRSRK